MSLRNIPTRVGMSSMIVAGTASVSLVLVAILAMSSGAESTVAKAGSPNRALVLSSGAISEATSNIAAPALAAIQNAPNVLVAGGSPLVSPESVVSLYMQMSKGGESNVVMRGLGEYGFRVHPGIRIVSGRVFRRGSNELIVGEGAARTFRNLSTNSTLSINSTEWRVVGTFSSNGDVHESEILADQNNVQAAFRHETFQSASVVLRSPAAFDLFKEALENNGQYHLNVVRETDYYADAARPIGQILSFFAYFIGSIMAVGAFIAAINGTYSAIRSRASELAILRAIGFSATPLISSVMAETLTLAFAGAILGVVLAILILDGRAADLNISTAISSQLSFNFQVTWANVLAGILSGLIVGLIAGLIPAIAIIRSSVKSSLH